MLSKANKVWSPCSYRGPPGMYSSGGNLLTLDNSYFDVWTRFYFNLGGNSWHPIEISVMSHSIDYLSADTFDDGNYVVTYIATFNNDLDLGNVSVSTNGWVYAYVITFDSNGGSSVNNGVTEYSSGTTTSKSFKIPNTIPTRDNCTFLGWGDSLYQPGDTITLNGDITLVAQWKTNIYVKVDGNWLSATNIFVKTNENWTEMTSIHSKIGSSWKQLL